MSEISISTLANYGNARREYVRPPIIEVKRQWSDGWRLEPRLTLERMNATVASLGSGEATFRVNYGFVRDDFDASPSVKRPLDVTGWWVRVSLSSSSGAGTVQWIGRFPADTRDLAGPDVEDNSGNAVEAGRQTLTAYGPKRELERIQVADSVWLVEREGGDTLEYCHWVPPLNVFDSLGRLRGNRSQSTQTLDNGRSCYVFGGRQKWSRAAILDYLLEAFANGDADGSAPLWTIGGQIDLLDDMYDLLSLGSHTDLAGLLDLLIPRELGLDWVPIPTSSGFVVAIFALTDERINFGGHSLPRNPDAWDHDNSQYADAEVTLARSERQRYGRITVQGARIVVVTSLWGQEAIDQWFPAPADKSTTLVPRWPSALETSYKNGTGNANDYGDAHDAARRDSRFLPVYQHFGVDEYGMPTLQHPTLQDAAGALIGVPVLEDGAVVEYEDTAGAGEVADPAGPSQILVRETLGRLPLRAGVDYATLSIDESAVDGNEAEFLPPLAWLLTELEDDALPENEDDERLPGEYVLAQEVGLSVGPLAHEHGVRVGVSPNHLLALNHWSSANDTEVLPRYDYEQMVATIAYRADARLRVSHTLDADVDGELVVDVPEAECVYVAPDTVIGLTDDRRGLQLLGGCKLSKSSDQSGGSGGTEQTAELVRQVGLVLRTDRDLLCQRMAGLLARYRRERMRVVIRRRGLHPLGSRLGSILRSIRQNNTWHYIHAPVTSVEWIAPMEEVPAGSRSMPALPTTVVRIGYA